MESHRARPRERNLAAASLPWLVAIAAYSVLLIVGYWYPFEFTTDRALVRSKVEGFFRVPLLSLYLGDEFNAIKQLLVRLLSFAPIGVMWAYVASLARTIAAKRLLLLVGMLYATALALGIEVAEVLMPEKVADSTEVVLCVAGALAGLVVAWRLLEPGNERPGRSPGR